MTEEARLERLHHVQLAIPRGGEAASRAFWGGVWFGGGGIEVHLGVEEPFAPARKAHPGVLVAGLRALAARLESADRR